jgi:hypothetical protein
VALTLRLTSSKVVVGEPASFEVSIAGGGAPPPYVLDTGDGSALQTRSDAAFTHVFQDARTYVVSVGLPPGIVGSGATLSVSVARRFPWWLIPVIGVLVIATTYAIRWMHGTHDHPQVHPGISLTFHPEPDVEPRFHPARPPGITVELHLVQNLTDMKFTPRVRISREG